MNAKILLNFARKIEECNPQKDTEGRASKMPDLVPLYVKLDGEGVRYVLPEYIKTDVAAVMKCSADTALMRGPEILFGGTLFGFEVKKFLIRRGRLFG